MPRSMRPLEATSRGWNGRTVTLSGKESSAPSAVRTRRKGWLCAGSAPVEVTVKESGTDAPTPIDTGIEASIERLPGRSTGSTVTPVSGTSPGFVIESVPVTGLPPVTVALKKA